ncbi:MAG: hypothetical protein IKE38_02085 [Erysipelotrichaceae bacterium]|nr:hypothetical protein [Erysipelotrichaceae bacterium]
MSEIDDKYPEYAEAKEPVRRGKHHKGLTWSFFAVAAVTLTTVFTLNASDGNSRPAKAVTVTIDVADKEEEYSGEEYVLSPEFSYTATEGDDDVSDEISVTLNKNAAVSVTDAGIYPFGLTADDFSVSSDKYEEFTVNVKDGKLEIKPLSVIVTVTGNTATVNYDRKEHSVEGYEIAISSEKLKESDILFSGEAMARGTNAGKAYMGLTASQFAVAGNNFDVTFDVSDGYLQINRARVNVTITGNSSAVSYDGASHSVSGYSVVIDNRNYCSDLFRFTGSANASRADIGTSYMGLNASMFRNLDQNFNVAFNITDGYIRIDGPQNDPPVINFDGKALSNVNLDMDPFGAVEFSFMPNDLAKEGGSAVFNIWYQDDTGTYVKDTEYEFTYTGDGDDSEVYVFIPHRMDESRFLYREKGKLTGTFTYPDGSTGTYESPEFYMYLGSFASINYDFGDDGILISENKVEIDIIIWEDIEFDNGEMLSISAENVEFEYVDFYRYVKDADGNWIDELEEYRETPDEITILTDDEGLVHMHLTYNFPEGVCPDGPYTPDVFFYSEIIETTTGWEAPLPYYF